MNLFHSFKNPKYSTIGRGKRIFKKKKTDFLEFIEKKKKRIELKLLSADYFFIILCITSYLL